MLPHIFHTTIHPIILTPSMITAAIPPTIIQHLIALMLLVVMAPTFHPWSFHLLRSGSLSLMWISGTSLNHEIFNNILILLPTWVLTTLMYCIKHAKNIMPKVSQT